MFREIVHCRKKRSFVSLKTKCVQKQTPNNKYSRENSFCKIPSFLVRVGNDKVAQIRWLKIPK